MKPSLELIINNTDELQTVSDTLLNFIDETRIVLFYAPMGAGKTTLIKELCKKLGSRDNFSSPTYSIINEYFGPQQKIYHFDLYRLKTAEELFDLGIEEYLNSGNYCFFEWPELVEEFIDNKYIRIEIEVRKNIRYLRATNF